VLLVLGLKNKKEITMKFYFFLTEKKLLKIAMKLCEQRKKGEIIDIDKYPSKCIVYNCHICNRPHSVEGGWNPEVKTEIKATEELIEHIRKFLIEHHGISKIEKERLQETDRFKFLKSRCYLREN